MKLVRRIGLATAAVVLGLGVVGATSGTAQADTSWGQKSKISFVHGAEKPGDTSWGRR